VIKKLPVTAGVSLQASPGESLDTLSPSEILLLLRTQGAVYLKGFKASMEQFYDSTEKFPVTFMDYRGGAFHRDQVEGRSSLMTVTGHESHFGIPLHGELYYQKQQPDVLLFYCQKPAFWGGETTVANAQRVYEDLAPEAKNFLEMNRLKYSRKMKASEWAQIYQTQDRNVVIDFCERMDLRANFDAQGNLTTEFVSSALVGEPKAFLNNLLPNYYIQRLGREEAGILTEDGKAIPRQIFKEIEKSCKAFSVKIPLQAGDLLLVDNRSTLHGRKSFLGQRKVYLRMGSLR
jgi:alpha-ketoglutarate-dependent taurine dioxygenase